MVLFTWPVGVLDELHMHADVNQYIFGLDDEMEGSDRQPVSLDGLFVVVPKGVKHGGTKIAKESHALFFWDGPL